MKLLPCPHCGEPAELANFSPDPSVALAYWVSCSAGCVNSASTSHTEAVSRWNRRADRDIIHRLDALYCEEIRHMWPSRHVLLEHHWLEQAICDLVMLRSLTTGRKSRAERRKLTV